ncbi:MAG: 50S ribosomal protein L22 [Candidatus Moraniibacteriota bacterium]|nr:MAG: 50S ribosomal protein L22 [Candidatus Moranbacteria bacterium]
MVFEAQLNNLRISPRKVRVVAGMLPGLSVREAEKQLTQELRRAALPLRKLLLSAASNAEHNFQAVPANLLVSKVVVNEGKKLKRWLPRAQGRATPLWKRMSHVSITLREEVPGLKEEQNTESHVDRGGKKKKKSSDASAQTSSKTRSFSGEKSVTTKGSSGKRSSRSLFHRKSV